MFPSRILQILLTRLGAFLIRSLNERFETVSLPFTQIQGTITIIPKGHKHKNLFKKKWRPISLLNISYNISSACIAQRIKRVMPSIIHEDQRVLQGLRQIISDQYVIYYAILKNKRNQNCYFSWTLRKRLTLLYSHSFKKKNSLTV